MTSRFTNDQVIDAYRRNGSVWRAGKELGIAGQTVHERLRALGHPLASQQWTDDEIAELHALVGHEPIGNIAHRLGRPYNGVACKISELGIGVRVGNRRVKVPRGAGYDKASCTRYMKQIEATGVKVTVFARRNSLGVESLCRALERHFPEWYANYRRAHSDIPQGTCAYCRSEFIPGNAKQVYCSRKCATDARTDRDYFGGNRRQTIGLLEGICQLCGREGTKGLTPHHVLGKENDPADQHLVALCMGCHQIVTLTSGRAFLDAPQGWESLISLVALRRHGMDTYQNGTWVYVEIEPWEDQEGETTL